MDNAQPAVQDQSAPPGSRAVPHAPVRVLIVEDEQAAMERLGSVVQQHPDLRLAHAATSVESASQWLADGRHQLDVMLVDLGLPDGSGLDLISTCQQLRPAVAIMVMTMFGDERHVFTALEKGASGYLLKSTPEAAIGDYVLDLHRGGSPITPTVARLVLTRMSKQRKNADTGHTEAIPLKAPCLGDLDSLTAREVDVLKQISVGYSTAEIASRLNISKHTVTAHIRSVYQKLQVHSRSAAIFAGQQQGWLPNAEN